MPNLILSYRGEEVECGLKKVDRAKLYGYITNEVLDENNEPCQLSTLSDDGKTVIGSGGLTYAYFSPDGTFRDKSDLKAVDLDGNALTPVKSTLGVPVELKEKVTVERYLDYNIRLIYALESGLGESGNGFPEAFRKELAEGAIYAFPFSYRGGLNPDTGFVLEGQDGCVWLAVGTETDVHLIGLEQAAAVVDVEEESGGEEAEDLMDFGMM